MKCPYCEVEIKEFATQDSLRFNPVNPQKFNSYYRDINFYQCPACENIIIEIEGWYDQKTICEIIYPSTTTPPKVDNNIPDDLKKDFQEAYVIKNLSPNASAALSRRCMQNILIQQASANSKDSLYDQIEFVIQNKLLPKYLLDFLHDVRVIGNFAAHPKFDCLGVILDTSQEEADFNLEAIKFLFDYYFVRAEKVKIVQQRIQSKKAAKTN